MVEDGQKIPKASSLDAVAADPALEGAVAPRYLKSHIRQPLVVTAVVCALDRTTTSSATASDLFPVPSAACPSVLIDI